jgi:hypothetical protein
MKQRTGDIDFEHALPTKTGSTNRRDSACAAGTKKRAQARPAQRRAFMKPHDQG